LPPPAPPFPLRPSRLLPLGGLGFRDAKLALYGIPTSKTLSLWLPWEGEVAPWRPTSAGVPAPGDPASSWFRTLAVCEVNEKRTPAECDAVNNVVYTVGGAPAPDVDRITAPGAQYLAKDVCVEVGIPAAGVLSARPGGEGVGLAVDVRVTGFVTLRGGACSVSHVVWEQVGTVRGD